MSNNQKEDLMNKRTALGRQMFSPFEDMKLKMLVMQIGCTNWKNIAAYMPNRTARQCRERYRNYLAPDLINGPWTKEEDDLLKNLFQKHGPKWSIITKHFRNRSEINVKNRWTSISKTLHNDTICNPLEQKLNIPVEGQLTPEDTYTTLVDEFTTESIFANSNDYVWNYDY